MRFEIIFSHPFISKYKVKLHLFLKRSESMLHVGQESLKVPLIS